MPLRLKKILLAGFKSFVDKTEIALPSNLCGIIGPNGCGKSNVIDAIRLVLGESSAKSLRGGQIVDMIFNGSSSRKPVGQASVELIFDNQDGSIGGEYAAFSEISIRREINREGISKYYLNGTLCRRKDITDMFRGTGMGPRGYSIITQGAISEIVEGTPEQFRKHLEEAAQISLYWDRRRETERRIENTRDNLSRILDIREELDKRLTTLARQSKAAKEYNELEQRQKRLEAEKIALAWQSYHEEVEKESAKTRELSVALEKHSALLAKAESEYAHRQQSRTEAYDDRETCHKRYFEIASEVKRLEGEVLAHQETLQDLQQTLSSESQSNQLLIEEMARDAERLEALQNDLSAHAPQLEAAQSSKAEAEMALEKAENHLATVQSDIDGLTQSLREPQQKAEQNKATLHHLEKSVQKSLQQQERLEQERQQLSVDDLKSSLTEKESELQQCSQKLAMTRERLDGIESDVSSRRDALDILQAQYDECQSRYQTNKGIRASLETLQAEAEQETGKALNQWIAQQPFHDAARLYQELKVDGEWQKAVETVLGDTMQALCVDDWDFLATISPPDSCQFQFPSNELEAADTTLYGRCESNRYVPQALKNFRLATSLDEALKAKASLSSSEAFITEEGILVYADRLVWPGTKSTEDTLLARQERLVTLRETITADQTTLEALRTERDSLKQMLRNLEVDAKNSRNELKSIESDWQNLKDAQAKQQSRLEQRINRRQHVEEELNRLFAERQRNETDSQQARRDLEIAMDSMDTLNRQLFQLNERRDVFRQQIQERKVAHQQAVQSAHQAQMHHQQLEQDRQSRQVAQERAKSQKEQTLARIEEVENRIQKHEARLPALKDELSSLSDDQMKSQSALDASNVRLAELDEELATIEGTKQQETKQVATLREQLSQSELAKQTALTRKEGAEEQFQKTTFTREVILAEMPEGANLPDWEEAIAKLERKIHRLGPINLAAIEEYDTEKERKEYLDAQSQDLEEALHTLETAISKIDRETRQKFKETYDTVNAHFSELFPKLFGGGKAHLTLTNPDDLLTTGVTVLAQPPGKRNTYIQQLSGGEKALTAVALVFAIFKLNPAPFCLLDEVDAPLDDANVGRFTQLVKDMSEQTQFLFITHNKVTMELADFLMGVTMREPGVSRLVSVNVNEAVELADA